jgi:hypothetical protein
MFRQLARLFLSPPPPAPPTGAGQPAAETVLGTHPVQLSRFLEEAWAGRNASLQALTPTNLEVPTDWPVALEGESGLVGSIPAGNRGSYPPPVWDHLIYAYMVENTRAYEIFRRVLEEYSYGERLAVPSNEGQRWLRTTEQLFYRDSPPFQVYSLASWIRPDIRAVRRNAYQRMFGLDLNHGTDDNRPYPYPRAAAANTDFTTTFESLLREVWRAIENVANQVGPNQTDISTLATLARTLYDMLRVRRQDANAGSLGRDELWHVSTMSWFHLTLSYNTPIVRDLKAEATSAAERLQKVGERVGLPAHSRAESYLHLAESMSLLLREIEVGTFNSISGATALFTPATGAFPTAIQETITHWSIATGRDVKARPTVVASPRTQPIRPGPRPIVAAPPEENGAGPREPLPV